MKAIDTIYKGYSFRSRLEARWAIFFDELGLGWEYELDGFEFPNGVKYLPDFRVGKTWVEIKPEAPSDGEEFKMCCLVSQSGADGLILAGSPGKQRMFVVGASEFPEMREPFSKADGESVAALVGLMLSEKDFGRDDVVAAINKSRSMRFYK